MISPARHIKRQSILTEYELERVLSRFIRGTSRGSGSGILFRNRFLTMGRPTGAKDGLDGGERSSSSEWLEWDGVAQASFCSSPWSAMRREHQRERLLEARLWRHAQRKTGGMTPLTLQVVCERSAVVNDGLHVRKVFGSDTRVTPTSSIWCVPNTARRRDTQRKIGSKKDGGLGTFLTCESADAPEHNTANGASMGKCNVTC